MSCAERLRACAFWRTQLLLRDRHQTHDLSIETNLVILGDTVTDEGLCQPKTSKKSESA